LGHFGGLGIATNIALLRAIAAEPDFQMGTTTTAYLPTHDFNAVTHPTQPPALVLAAAALWEVQSAGEEQPHPGPVNPWTNRVGVGSSAPRRFRYTVGVMEHVVTLTPASGGEGYSAEIDGAIYDGGQPLRVAVSFDGRITLFAGDMRATVYLARRGPEVLAGWHGASYRLAKPQALTVEAAVHAHETGAGRQTLAAPMAGTILKGNVAEGEAVQPHQTLGVLGAMKLGHAIISPYPAKVVRVTHAVGDVVPGGEALVELDSGA